MTFEARNQLKDIMLLSGFPEECLYEHTSFDPFNDDPKLDIISSLLSYALYPNVCFHIDKRKLITCDGKQALINKNSVNCGREIASFASPFFVFGEKIKTRAVSAKQMTMVTPVQLLLFASDKIEISEQNPNLICLDNWIYLRIEPSLARLLLSMRQALQSVLANCTQNPEQIVNRPKNNEVFIQALNMLSDLNDGHVIFRKDTQEIQGSIQTTSSVLFGQKRNYSNVPNYQEDSYETDMGPQLKRLAHSVQNCFENNQSFNNDNNNNNNNYQESREQALGQQTSLPNLMSSQGPANNSNFNRFNNSSRGGFRSGNNFQRGGRGGRGGASGGSYFNNNNRGGFNNNNNSNRSNFNNSNNNFNRNNQNSQSFSNNRGGPRGGMSNQPNRGGFRFNQRTN